MAAPNIMTLFTTMYGYVESAIAGAVATFGSGLVSFVAAPLALAATIYFLLLGFAVLRGAIQAPLRELVFQAGKVGFALAAASCTFLLTAMRVSPAATICTSLRCRMLKRRSRQFSIPYRCSCWRITSR